MPDTSADLPTAFPLIFATSEYNGVYSFHSHELLGLAAAHENAISFIPEPPPDPDVPDPDRPDPDLPPPIEDPMPPTPPIEDPDPNLPPL